MKTGFQCSGLMGRNDVINYPIQGAAFHCLLWAFIELDRVMQKEKWDTKLIGQIHDAIVLDVNPDELKHVLKTVNYISTIALRKAWNWIIVPLRIEAELCPVDGNWADKKGIKI
jgi:DNA polymerase I-like protein with 3'-5' exonuclease and polymerase domains